jgi:hypothetical protein
MSGPSLVILAAGAGRRFGGLKQLTPVGPGGETLMDYTVHDARRAGFDEVVLVIRREIADEVHAHVNSGFGQVVPVHYVYQEPGPLPAGSPVPAGRLKPWGTGQAVLAAASRLSGPFAVANADDHYGTEDIATLGAFLARPATNPPTWAMVGFPVADTLPASGPVSRGLVRARRGWLEAIDEVHTVRRHADGACWDAPEEPRILSPAALVSMNLWGFGPEILDDLARRFQSFLAARPGPDDEFYLPLAVGAAVAEGTARVRVLSARSRWCGMTSAADLAGVKHTLADLVARGVYPSRLYP